MEHQSGMLEAQNTRLLERCMIHEGEVGCRMSRSHDTGEKIRQLGEVVLFTKHISSRLVTAWARLLLEKFPVEEGQFHSAGGRDG